MKNQKGITLIALIITIIVMLILVAVTLSIVLGDNGILNKARTGTRSQTLEQERETLQAAVLGAYDEVAMEVDFDELDENLPSGFTGSNGTYTSPTGNVFSVDKYGTITATGSSTGNGNNTTSEVPDELVDYLLGTDHEGRIFIDFEGDGGIVDPNTFTFKKDENLVFDASEVTFLTTEDGEPFAFDTSEYCDDDGNEVSEMMLYCNYEGIVYRFLMQIIYNEDEETEEYYTKPIDSNTTIEVAYEEDSTSNVGKYVKWDTDGDGTLEDDELWIVLYDDNTNGMQIISANTMQYDEGYLYLGYNDTYLTKKGTLQGSTDLEKSIYSYNNAITTLNSACDEIITNRTNVTDVRCIGSNPTKKSSEASTYYTSAFLASNPTNNVGAYNGVGKAGDLNGLTDYDRMVGLGIAASENEEDYWLASRCVREGSDGVYFRVRYVVGGGGCGNGRLWGVYESRAYVCYYSGELRPVVSLSSNIQLEGVGTKDSPCTIK